jgi:hypothetical protein
MEGKPGMGTGMGRLISVEKVIGNFDAGNCSHPRNTGIFFSAKTGGPLCSITGQLKPLDFMWSLTN